jgi:predicted AlkP superfamily phosphohydrolase/phosphomutase
LTATIALGLDGATWDMLDGWIDDGRLPALERVVEEGCRATLESVVPPVTCPAWKCYSTGKNPGDLGVFWWAMWDRDGGRIVTPNHHSFRSADLWDYLGDAGYRSAVLNMPTTYPPKPLEGIMVSGFGAPLDRNFDYDRMYTYPPELQADLEDRYGYRVGLKDIDYMDKKALFDSVVDLINLRFRVLVDLLSNENYDFIHLTIFYINILQHYYGDDEVTGDAWEVIDGHIEELLDDYRLVLFSDHGNMDIERSFIINDWLLDQGYLRLRHDAGDLVGAVTGRLDRFCTRALGFERRYFRGAMNLLPDRFIERFPGVLGQYATNQLDLKVDWDRSLAIGMGQGPIYLNHERLDYPEQFRATLADELQRVTDPDGKRVLRRVRARGSVYRGRFTGDAPDLVADPMDGVEIHGGITGQVHRTRQFAWTSGNHPDGMFAAHGPGIATDWGYDRLHLTDIAPTLCYGMDVPVPEDMDGAVRTDLFERRHGEVTFQPGKSPVGTTINDGRQAEVRKNLEDLGYLG